MCNMVSALPNHTEVTSEEKPGQEFKGRSP